MKKTKLAPFVYTLQTNKVFFSKEAREVIEITEPYLELQEIKKTILHKDWKVAKEAFFKALEGHMLDVTVGVYVSNKLLRLNIQGYWTHDDNGIPYQLNGFFQELQENQNDAPAKLSEQGANKIKEIFLANISHEIRTPLNAIVGFLELLSNQVQGPDGKYYLELINESTQSLLTLINDVLDFTKMEANKEIILKKQFNLHDLLVYVAEIYYPKKTQELEFALVIRDNLPEQVIGDPERLKQILTNPLNNSFNYTQKGKIELEVQLSKEPVEEGKVGISFVVRDSGEGIAEDEIKHIFEPFYQAKAGNMNKPKGTGIGLAIVKKLVEAYGGKVTVQSELNKGTELSILIPFEKATQKIAPNSKSLVVVPDLAETKVLIVEDNLTNQVLLKEVLKQTRCQVEYASNGLEAIKALEEKDIDLVFMDFQMPVMDGIAATKHIRNSNKHYANVPILGVTANTWENDIQYALDVGMNDIISKPFKQEDFFNKVMELLQNVAILETKEGVVALDLSLVESYIGTDKDVQHNFLTIAKNEVNDCFEAINDKLLDKNLQVQQELHKMKGIFGYLSETMRKNVATLEASVKQGELNLTELKERVKSLQIKSGKIFNKV